MLAYSEFKDYIVEHIKDVLPEECADADIKIEKYAKPNTGEIESILIMPKDSSIAPAFRISEYYKEYQGGETLEGIMERIRDSYQRHEKSLISVPDIEHLKEWDVWKDKITARVVNREKNQTLMGQVPWREIEGTDLVMLYDIFYSNEARMMVQNDLAELWGKKEEDLYTSAMSFLQKEQVVCNSLLVPNSMMSDDGENRSGIEVDMENGKAQKNTLYSLTNESEYFGTAAILQPGLLEKLEKWFQGEFIIFPTSVHELIIAKKDEQENPLELQIIVICGNKLLEKKEDYLSNNVYEYSNGEIKTITDEMTLMLAKHILNSVAQEEREEMDRVD